MKTFQIPPTTGLPIFTQLLSRHVEWMKPDCRVVDLAPGVEYLHNAGQPTLLHVLSGTVGNLSAGQYLALGPGCHVLGNTGQETSRMVMMELHGGPIIPGSVEIAATPTEERPLGIVLKSLIPRIMREPTVGYEYVELSAGHTIPRHLHHRSRAIALIVSGSGFVGRQINGCDLVEWIVPGSVTFFPAGMEHGFQAREDLVLVSFQFKDLGDDYQGVPKRQFRYGFSP